MPKTTLYYDVTQLIHWSGALAGIPRVMHELAVRYQADTTRPVVFVAWVKEIQDFCEVNLSATLAHRGQGIVYVKEGEQSPEQENKAVKSDTQVDSQPITPSLSLKKGLKKIAKTGLNQASKISPRLAHSIEWRANIARMKTYKRVLFQAEDVLFIPWGEWWDPHFITKLIALHGGKTKVVPLIHDVGPMVVPHLSGHSTDSLSDYCARVVPIADVVLVVSKNTKKDLTDWLKKQKLPVPPIRVFRLGDSIEIAEPQAPKDPLFTGSGLKGGDFILCVGTLEAKKNHTLFYYVYNLAKQNGVALPKLVMVGRRGWKTENIFDIMSADPEGKFIFLTHCSDQELSWLYDHCLFTVLPSFYEGWGIPIAESVARGVPCLCSNTSSMVEVAEGIAEHFSPYSPEECLEGIQRWLDPAQRKVALERTKNYQQFSWDDSFDQVKKYLEDV